ncbi:long-chain-acyl-CoA synthetase [Salinisphaera sp. Q1T1-3]|uniref:long-chain-acyl-CoA synthetase n=1 Tax=Salinisphaera sp. Q1T1-3 TaxID=2321229 RepID=UPI000E73AEE2|nr:long-chain-acyl-CoA synthetase [Salinisphaera sp. Q1T1-3]RJS91956.1 long-chain-acyl-CoA synthetase [Salinisphaera sp. Q1T1-3]
MSEAERQTVNAWDVLKPNAGQFERLGAVVRGIAMLVRSRFNDRLTIATLVEAHARRRPAHPALVFDGQVWTYRQFNAQADRLAATLAGAGITHGDVVALLMDNRAETLILVAALAKLGAPAAMCNTKQRGEVLAHSLGTVEPKALIVGDELTEAFEEIAQTPVVAGLARIWRMPAGEGKAPASAYPDLSAEAAARPETDGLPGGRQIVSSDTCFYIFTSGTTGMPKASRMSHRRWLRGGAGLGLLGLRLGADDRFYCPLPLYHNNALTVSWASVLCAGATFCLAPRFSVSDFWADIRRHEATVFSYIGELCRYLLSAEPAAGDRDHRVRAVIGNGLRPDIWDDFKSRFGIARICEFYGASEGNLVFVNGFNVERTAGFCPLPYAVVDYDPETEKPVTDEAGRMREVPRGSVGLLLNKVTDFAPFEGYTDPEAGKAKLYHGVFKDGDCYFDTGDLVRRQGMRHIAFADRLGDTFRWKGENVATTQVENAVNGFSGVSEAVVYGVAVPGTDGRAGMVAITPTGDADAFDWTGLARHLQDTLPAYAVPVFARIKPEQEMTGTLKYRKVDLKEDGYDPASGDIVYMRADSGRDYTPIDEATRARLNAGELTL